MLGADEILIDEQYVAILLNALDGGREATVMAHASQVGMVQQSLVRELAHDVYVRRRDDRKSMTPSLRLARIETLLDESIVELAIIKRDVRAMIEHVKGETG